jgi:hypothetical protein
MQGITGTAITDEAGNDRTAVCLQISCKEFLQHILKSYTSIPLSMMDSMTFPQKASDPLGLRDIPVALEWKNWTRFKTRW